MKSSFVTTCFLLLSCVARTGWAEQDEASVKKRGPVTVGVLIFEGVELLDFAGPAEVFAVAGYGDSFKVSTVSNSTNPIKTMGGIQVIPDFAAKDAPRFDVIVIPGGAMSNVDARSRQWIKDSATTSDIVMSVCMGAFLLADAGLLDDVKATTHHWGIQGLKKAAPKCTVLEGQRFVDAGKIITTAGVTAGIDGALHVIQRYFGKKAAEWTANEWMEHRLQKPAAKSDGRTGAR